MKKLNFLLFTAFTCLTSSAYAEVKSFTPHFPKFYSSAATRKADNQFYSLGEAKFLNGVTVPFMVLQHKVLQRMVYLKTLKPVHLKAAILILNSRLNTPNN